jgi:hypothetical protein
VHLKKNCDDFSMFFVVPILIICPNAREPISIAIPFDLSRKKGAMMQKANISHGKLYMVDGRDGETERVILCSSLKVVV